MPSSSSFLREWLDGLSDRRLVLWGTFAFVAAFVVVFAGVSIASSLVAGDSGGASGSREPVRSEAPSSGSDDGEGSAVSAGVVDSAAADGQQQDSAQDPVDPEALASRDADFAVDPARADWNFSTNGKKTVYLTIDDGPSAMTEQVLDILDRYGCKATFFVVGHNDDYFPMIAEAYRRGHTIGLHTYTHDYAQVYSSTAAYFADLDEIGAVVAGQIGYVPCFIRFPGGSSNAISADFTPGIMSELVGEVQERGYQYYDWNLSVGDGSEHTADEIFEYGTAHEDDENIMLLCHDSATKQSTVDALPRIIEHYQSLGYAFEAIDRESWVCHHGVSN